MSGGCKHSTPLGSPCEQCWVDSTTKLKSEIAVLKTKQNDMHRCNVLKQREHNRIEAKLSGYKQLAVELYTAGYHAGHNDTVESTYVDILPEDCDSYFSGVVAEWINERQKVTKC